MEQMPPLVSFAVFDGIPPQEEGEDPTVFWYWPNTISMDDQLNEIGLYLTFNGFCRDFRASKDCQYFQTDKGFTCFVCLGADVYAAACFETLDEKYYRVLVSTIELFANIYRLFFPAPYRLSDNSLDKATECTFKSCLDEMIKIFQHWPFLSKLTPSTDLWTSCEEAIANMKQRLPNVRSAAFIYQNRIVHSSMDPKDALALYSAYKCPLKTILQMDSMDSGEQGKLNWVVGLEKRDGVILPHLTRITMADGPAYPVIMRYDLILVIVAFSEPRALEPDEFSPLEETLLPFVTNIRSKCVSALQTEGHSGQSIIYKDDGMCHVTKPMSLSPRYSLGNASETEGFVRFLEANRSDFVRFTAQSGMLEGWWMFMEKDGEKKAMVNAPAKTIPDMTDKSVEILKTAIIG